MNNFITRWLARKALPRVVALMASRPPDFVITGRENDPYLNRWWMFRRNRWFNVYLHEFLRDDEDRALHDHPWPSLSLALNHPMQEVYLARRSLVRPWVKKEHTRAVLPGDVVWRGPRFAHRMIVPHAGAITIFVTGPRVREWGFLCPKGWVPWQTFTARDNPGAIGRGCD